MTRLLNISTDRKILEKGSSVRKRMVDYGALFDEYYIIVYSLKSDGLPKIDKISSNVWAISTGSASRLDYIRDAVRIGRQMAGIDWVSAQDPFESGWAGMKLAEYYDAKLNVQVHTDFLNKYFKYSSFLNFIRSFMAPRVLKKADSIRVVSQRVKASLKEAYKFDAPIKVLPIYMNTKKLIDSRPSFDLRKKYPALKNIILSVGRLEQEKNFDLTIEVFSEILKDNPRSGLFVVGGSAGRKDLEEKLKEKIKALKIDKNVFFEGWSDDLASYYKSADIYLSTSKYEGYGLTLVEASVSGTPVVTTDVGIAGDILMNKINSMICPVGDKKCLVESLKRLIEDKDFHELIKKNAENVSSKLMSGSKSKYLQDYKAAILGK